MADGTQVFDARNEAEILSLFDPKTGALDRRILSDEGVYRLELERIFARGWNFMCHESQLKNPGDYLVSYIGEDQVIVARDEAGQINAMLNTCRHRGNALCRAEKGRAKSFVCSYHGWNYALDGRLIGVPGQRAYYHDDLDRSRLGLAKARVESYLGFYFATLAEDAPPLEEFLGEAGRAGLGMVCAHGEVEAVEGIQKNIIDCNWKVAHDNLFDWYHVMYSHASANAAGFADLPHILQPKSHMTVLGEYGHMLSGPAVSKDLQAQIDEMSDEQRVEMTLAAPPNTPRVRPQAATALMGPVGVRAVGHAGIFPNFWVTLDGMQICLRLPRGPSKTELWWFTFPPKDAPPALRQRIVWSANHVFGPAGLLEQDDGDNWTQSTRSARSFSSRALSHNVSMGLGRGEAQSAGVGQSYVESPISEYGQRWLYQNWMDWMVARDWNELKSGHSQPPTGVV